MAKKKPLSSSGATVTLHMRLSAGKHAVRAAEAEVIIDGIRVAGDSGPFEFDLYGETWVEIRIIRP